MSQLQNLEEVTARQLSLEIRDTTSSFSRNIQRGPHSGPEIQGTGRIRKLLKSCCAFIDKVRPYMKKISETHFGCRNWMVLGYFSFVLDFDILFLYIPWVNDDRKCIGLDKDMLIKFIVWRSLFDLFYAIDKIFRLAHTGIHKNARKQSRLSFLIDILIVLPIPQVLLILAVMKRLRGTDFLFGMIFFLFQQALRVIQVYHVYINAQALNKSAEWALLFSFFHVYTSVAIGALWYFFAIERVSACWKKACINHAGCGDVLFHCDDHLGDYKFLNDFCPTKTQNSTIFDHGIFRDAFLSGILETTNLEQKVYYCSRWGLQSLSSFGQGLQTSISSLENTFVGGITVSGVFLLIIVVGEFQSRIQSESVRSMGMRQKVRQLDLWLPFRKLSQNLQWRIKHHLYEWEETSGFDLENLVNNLSEDIGREITCELCLALLNKVEEFRKWCRASREDLCDFVKPVIYTQSSYIIHEGDLIDKMIFVVQGNLQTYNSGDIASARPDNSDSERDRLKDGDFCGEEVVGWAQDACTRTDSTSPDLPISTRTIQALTKVEAFALMADDLKNILLVKQKRVAPFIKVARFMKLPWSL